MAQQRAPKGGTVGMNGEQYAGGEFLPSTRLASRTRERGTAKERKQNYAPYAWGFTPVAGQRAIYAMLQGVMMYDRAADAFEVFAPYYSQQSEARRAEFDDMISRYNRGERWV